MATAKTEKTIDTSGNKKTSLDKALKQIRKDYGEGSIMKLGDAAANMNIEVIPTGALSLGRYYC